MMRTPLLSLILLAPLLGGIAESAGARPLHAARTGRPCAACHVDPAGGGIRTGTGFRFAYDGHTFAPDEIREPTLDPRISDGIRIGGDLRTQYMHDIDNARRDRSTFFQMQAELMIAAELNDRLAAVYTNGDGRTREAFGLIRALPLDGTLKVGRFRPAYGIEVEDHTTFTRDALGFGNGSEDTGIELSLFPGPAMVQLAAVNGSRGIFDDNPQKGLIGRIWWYGERAGVGASGATNRPATTGVDRDDRAGLFAQIHHGRFVLLAEYDRGRREQGAGEAIDLEAAFVEASWLLSTGRTVKLRYDRFDPDLDLAENALDRAAIGLEQELFPLARFLTFVRFLREYGTDEGGNRPVYGKERDTIEWIGQLHLSF